MSRISIVFCLSCLLAALCAPSVSANGVPPGAEMEEFSGDATVSGVRGAFFPAFSPDGSQITFSMHGDIWVVPVEGGYARRITLSDAYDTKPRWSPDGRRIAFSSKRAGNYDLWITNLEGGAPRQVTFDYAFDSLTDWSTDGTLLYFHSNRDGRMNVWRIPAKGGLAEQITVTGGRDGAVSPDGSLVFFADGRADLGRKMYRGSSNWDIYRLNKIGDIPKPVTTFDGNDRSPFFARDGLSFFYLSERNGMYNIYRRTLETGEESAVTSYKDDDVRMPHLAFDGSRVAYVYKNAIWITELAAGKTRQVPLSIHSDLKGPAFVTRTITNGAEQPSWSPDGRSMAFQLRGDIWIMPASGGKARQITSGPSKDEWPVFSPQGDRIAFFSDRSGNKDIWILSLRGGNPVQITRHAKDDFYHDWSPDGTRLVFSSERSGNKDIWLIDIASKKLEQLTRHSTADDDPVFSPDGKLIAFDSGRTGSQNIYTIPVTGGTPRRISQGRFDQVPTWSPDSRFIAYEVHDVQGRPAAIWVMAADGSCRNQVTTQGSCPRWAPRGQTIAYERQSGSRKLLYTAEAPANLAPGLPINFMAVLDVNVLKERAQAFEEAWRLIKDSFYDPKMHGVDWAKVKKKYEPLAKNLRTDEELIGLINRMLGELKASHMGFWGRTPQVKNPAPPTGYLGMRLERKAGDGPRSLTVTEVMPGGPADKVWIRKGDHVFSINGKTVGKGRNVAKALSGTVGREISVRVGPSATGAGSRRVKIKPVTWGAIRGLDYQRWVKKRMGMVRAITRGKVGYIHLRMMGERDLEQFKRAIAGPLGRTQGLILDVRNNGGGRIHEALLDILTRRPFGAYHPRGGKRTKQPKLYYQNPVVVLINERSFSDAEVFPHGFKALKRGKVVGVPTNGAVIGTGSATLINGFTLRLPRVGWYALDGTNLEGLGVKPDILVKETPEDRLHDRDPQLKKAIEVVIAEIREKKAKKKVDEPRPAKKTDTESRTEEEY